MRMKPQTIVDNLKKLLNFLEYQKRYAKNKPSYDSEISRCKETLLNIESLLNNRLYYSESTDTLILEIILLRLKLESKEEVIPADLKIHLELICEAIQVGRNQKAQEICSIIKLPYEALMLKDYEKHEDLMRVKKLIDRMKKDSEIKKDLVEMINIIKQEIWINTEN